VNNAGEFNAPFGRYKNPNIVNEPILRAVSKYLNTNEIELLSGDYETVLDNLDQHFFVYLGPPYHPISVNSNFTGSSSNFIKDQYKNYNISIVKANRAINSDGIKYIHLAA
jgi:DNA adenine methylase